MFKKILVIKHGALGDLIFASGAFQAIRKHHQGDQVILLTSSPFKKMMESSGYFDEIWIDDRPNLWAHPLQWWQLFKKLKADQFDRVYDLQRSKRTRWYFRIMKWFFHPLPEWSGTMKGATFHYSIPHNYAHHIIVINQQQLEAAHIHHVPLPSLDWMREDIDLFNLPEKYFLLVPGCSPTQLHKRWPAENYGKIAQYLNQHGITPVILGTTEEKEAITTIMTAEPRCINLMGKTSLFQIAELGRHAMGALGHDTGPMHMLVYVHCPSLLLFSYSSGVNLCDPLAPESTVIHSHHLKDISVEKVIKNRIFTRLIPDMAES